MSPFEQPESASPGVTPTESALAPPLTGTITDAAPPCPASMKVSSMAAVSLPVLARGQIIEDYEILREIGSGGFARVYLARQISLARQVALKVSPNIGSEARTLARLEHHHIVQVFAEIVIPERNLRLLCMQFVPGTTLARLIGSLKLREPHNWNGQTYLTILDQLCTEPTTFDLGGLSVRAFLEKCDDVELTCWLGARLAEALAHAHSQGVIHRDIKPANILLNRYGRPSLADFNIALNTESGEGIFGGTLAYMAPEHLNALLAGASAAQDAVDVRSDLYSLALVLLEVLTGTVPASDVSLNDGPKERLRRLMSARLAGAPSPRAFRPELPELIDRLLRRCLEPNTEKRFSSAESLMHALDGCRDLVQVDKEPDQQSRLLRTCRAWPFGMLLLLAVLPHVVGSVVNVSYNGMLIRNPRQQACFDWLVLAYNSATYPLVVLPGLLLLGQARRGWLRLRAQIDLASAEAARCRRRILALPGWIVFLSCLGWFPGGILFPAGLNLWAGPISAGDALHFVISFAISGLIASTYTYFGVQFVVLRVLYPSMWSDPSSARSDAQRELHGLPRRLRRFQLLAVLIPLVGAALLISAGPDQLSLTFRLLVTSLIVLGLAGFALATRVCNRLTRVLSLLTGTAREES